MCYWDPWFDFCICAVIPNWNASHSQLVNIVVCTPVWGLSLVAAVALGKPYLRQDNPNSGKEWIKCPNNNWTDKIEVKWLKCMVFICFKDYIIFKMWEIPKFDYISCSLCQSLCVSLCISVHIKRTNTSLTINNILVNYRNKCFVKYASTPLYVYLYFESLNWLFLHMCLELI